MDATKKRKVDDNNNGVSSDGENPETATTLSLTPSDARKIIEKFTTEQLIDIVQSAALRHRDVLASVRSIADGDVTQRKLFVRGLGWETTTDNLRNIFSQFGELEEAVVIVDKATTKSKGYGFVTFRHVDGAILALKEPSKKIDGRVTVTQLAAAGNSGQGVNSQDVSMRKIYVANVPKEMPSEKLCAHFAQYGEIEEGPLGYDKMTGNSKGFALFVYKTAEGAQAALVDPVKMVEGKQLNCKLAIEGKKKGGPQGGGHGGQTGGGDGHGDGIGMGGPNSMAGPMGGHYGGPGGMGSYGGFSGPPMGHHMNSSMQAAMGGQGGSAVGAQGGHGGAAGGYGGGMGGGPYGGYGGAGSTGYGGMSGAGAGVGGGMGGGGGGGGGYRMPPSSAGMASGGYPESGHYNNLSSGSGFPNQHHQATGASPLPRVPPGGMYPNVPPYY